ncbi:hypothetical protein PI124_g20493 [Phytophthora idaei]|nr:hypothetical protein PI124_g20493 [Phytophthora idaei]
MSNAGQGDAHTGIVPVGTVPLFAPVTAPEITSVSYKDIVKWGRERREYENRSRARCRVSGEDFDALCQTVKDSFNHDLLEVFEENKQEMSTEVLAVIQKILSSVKNDALPDIKGLL